MEPAPAVILGVDGGGESVAHLEAALRSRYGSDYEVVCERDATAAGRRLEQLCVEGRMVAVVLADQWLEGRTGIELLEFLRSLHPLAKRGLLVSRGDWSVREPMVRAIALGQIDGFLPKRARTPDEQFHRLVTEYLDEWHRSQAPPTRFEAMGATAPKGVLLFGPPGCGKTLLARAVAGESGVPFVSASGTELVESLVGVGAARVRDLFAQVRELAPAILFLDEVDAVARKREGEGVSGGEREQTLNQLLVEMDGFDLSAGVVVLAATNRPDILDSAVMRPGRFDRHITLEPPDVNGRRAILTVHAKGRPLTEDVDLDQVAARTPGFTGADLANVFNEAALLSVRSGRGQIGQAEISEAISRVLHGPHRPALLSPAERTRVATHEAAHALVATAVGRGADVHRISVVARGLSLGTTAVGGDDRVLHTAPELADQLAMALAGTAAEDAYLGSVSTTAEDDIQRANSLARQMVGLYGMSAAVGRIRILSRSVTYLGEEGGSLEAVSGRTVETFDAEVRRLIDTAEARAKAILEDNRRVLDALVTRLEVNETLEDDALAELLAPVVPAPPVSTNGSAGRKKAIKGAGSDTTAV